MTTEANDYDSLADLLDRSGSPLILSELHGGLSGVLCAAGIDVARQWLEDLMDDCTGDADTLAELASMLARLGDSTWRGLHSPSLDFTPYLPGEDDQIEQRAEALGFWCHGFLAGLVIGGLDLSDNRIGMSDDMAELVNDFAQISRAGADASEMTEPDTGEGSLIELVEYVRVGALCIFEELAAESASAGQHTIH